MSASAGRVLLKPKGPYNALTAYTPLDYVTYTDGNTYVCHTPTTGHAPTDTNYWQILVDNSGVVHTVDIANNLTTQTAGKVLDASQGYALNTSLAQKTPKSDIAIIESGTTASANRAKGDFVYVNGILYKVIAAISTGATYTVGTNIEVATVGGEFALRANWKFYSGQLTSDSTYGTIRIPNASQSFIQLVSSATQPYHLDYVSTNLYIVRDATAQSMKNITVKVVALYID